jgi:hypothetical protein
MKKIVLLIIIALSVSTPAFATATAASGVSDVEAQTLAGTAPAALDIGRSSKGVLYAWSTSLTGYAIATYHMSGTKFYGTTYDSTKFFFDDVGTGATLTAPTSSAAAEAFPLSSWTAM